MGGVIGEGGRGGYVDQARESGGNRAYLRKTGRKFDTSKVSG